MTPTDGYNISSLYKIRNTQFRFESPIKTIVSPNQGISLWITSNFKTSVTSIVQEQKGSVPYNATLHFVNTVTGEKIVDYKIIGVWSGVRVAAV